jgi:hypothetical protein
LRARAMTLRPIGGRQRFSIGFQSLSNAS